MLVRIPIILLTLFCLNIPLLAQSASRLKNEKPLAGLEKKIKANLEAAAAESATLKIPENRAFLYFRIADILWDFDEEGARAMIEESRSAISRLVSAPDYNPSNSQSGYYHQQLRREFVEALAETDAERAFALYESLIEPINQIASAYIRMCRFDGWRCGATTKDEMLIQRGLGVTQAILAFVEETKSLARSDFDHAMDLAGRFRQTELRVYAELNAIQAVSSKR